MRQALLLKLLTLTCVVLALMAALPGCEEPTDPSLEPPEVVESPTTTASAPSVATTAPTANAAAGGAPRTPAEYRKAAEAGDVPSMLLLGRSHESLGQTADARKWYQRAADAGNEEGKSALAQLDASASTHQASPTTAPANVVAASAPANSPSTRRVAIEVPPAADPTKLRWIDIGAVLNYEDIIADGQMVNVDPRSAPSPGQKQVFIGRCSARDGSIVVAAMGASEGDLNEVTAVIRVKNRVDPSTSPRVAQAGAVTARVTADNVNPREFLEWITQYLQTEQRSEPIFRNGWRITVSGSAAEGRKDPKPQLGTAVMIEMKK